MRISLEFLEQMISSKIMKIYRVPRGYNTFEYAKQHYLEATVFGTIELENEIISDLDNKTIGYFGINFEHNIMAYYLKI